MEPTPKKPAPRTVVEVIQATTAFFQKSGVAEPRLNIEHLLAHVLGKKRLDLYLEFDRALTDSELEPLRALVKRRAQGEPLQHLLGTAEFLGRTFLCDKRGLIPRPETEQLVQMLIEKPAPTRALDVGTGSGVIALSLAAAWPATTVEAVDLSSDALALAQENARRLDLAERVIFHESDLLAGVTGPFELIVANLPYISSGELPALAREIHHDPRAALDGGADGLQLIRRLIREAVAQLRGCLALEIGSDQSAAVCAELSAQNYHDIRPLTDYQGRSRFVLSTYG